MRCILCQSLPPLLELEDKWSHHSVTRLKEFKEKGCDLCAAIYERLFHSLSLDEFLGKHDEKERDRMRVQLTYDKGPGTFQWEPTICAEELGHRCSTHILRIDVTNGQDVVYQTSHMALVLHRSVEPCPRAYCRKLIGTSHGCADAFEFVRNVSQDCRENHKECKKNIDVPLPTYTLFVGGQEGAHPTQEKLRIIHNHDGTLQGTYVTLSYCWGGLQAVQLTQAALEKYQSGLSISSLPATLRDAVLVTQQLGFQYLWIDSLCIIQDDEKSKMREIKNMGNIYGRSFLTIQASMAPSVNKGFLASRKTSAAPVQLLLHRGSDHCPPVFVYGCAPKAMMPMTTSASERAWIFQEGTLTSRLLLYLEDQIVFVCRSQWAPEDGTNGPIWLQTGTPNNGESAVYADDTHSELALKWYWALFDYTSRKCSVSDDRLTALAGFAESLQPSFSEKGGRYLAGLWEADLLYGLQWMRQDGMLVRAASYRAPSWSWAAYEGKTGNIPRNYEPRHPRPRIISAWTTPKNGYSQYGPCSDGRIVLATMVGCAYCIRASTTGPAEFALQFERDGKACGEVSFDTKENSPEDSSRKMAITCAFLADDAGLVLLEVVQDKKGGEGAGHTSHRRFQRIGLFHNSSSVVRTLMDGWREACLAETIELV